MFARQKRSAFSAAKRCANCYVAYWRRGWRFLEGEEGSHFNLQMRRCRCRRLDKFPPPPPLLITRPLPSAPLSCAMEEKRGHHLPAWVCLLCTDVFPYPELSGWIFGLQKIQKSISFWIFAVLSVTPSELKFVLSWQGFNCTCSTLFDFILYFSS